MNINDFIMMICDIVATNNISIIIAFIAVFVAVALTRELLSLIEVRASCFYENSDIFLGIYSSYTLSTSVTFHSSCGRFV